MKQFSQVAWAAMLGLLLATVGLAGAASNGATPSEGRTQELQLCGSSDVVGLGLGMRWGYLNDPMTGGLRGHWSVGDTPDAGMFRGVWRSENGRINGTVEGRWRLGPDGVGEFSGQWANQDGSPNGTVRGEWVRAGERPGGRFAGMWTFGDRPAGVVKGLWRADSETGGPFAGLWIHERSLDTVPWDGFLEATRGATKLLRVVRFEHGGDYRMGTDDLVYPRDNRLALEWRSSTVTNWDGLIAVWLVPKSRPMPHLTIHTDQASFVFEAGEVPGLHIRRPVDRAGHEIEIRGFRVDVDRCQRYALFHFAARWGFLPENGSLDGGTRGSGPARWDGFLQVTDGGVRVRAVMNWESRGNYTEGRDDYVYRRDNPFAVEWRSSTTSDWDGIAFTVALPFDRPEPHLTLHAGPWSRVFEMHELLGLHLREPVGDLGLEVEVVSLKA